MWIGKKASQKEKQEAMRNAVGFLKKKDYPSDTKVTRVVENAEPSDFKCLFRDWPQPAPTGRVYARGRIGEQLFCCLSMFIGTIPSASWRKSTVTFLRNVISG